MHRLPAEPPSWVAGFIGKPFQEQGRSLDGADCWGGVCLVYQQRFGVALPPRPEELDQSEFFGQQSAHDGPWRVVSRDDLRVGDVAAFRIPGQRRHVGVVVARGLMLHWIEGVQSCVERWDSPTWSARLLGFYRYHGPVVLAGRVAPFPDQIVRHEIPEGGTIDDLIRASGIRPNAFMRVWVGGREVPPHAWKHIRPKAGRLVTVSALPLGGGGQGGKTAARLILTIAVVAAAVALPYAGVFAGTALAAGELGGALLSAGVGIAGSLLVNSLIPPPRTRISDGTGEATSPSITGAGNEARPFGVVPVIFGTHRVVPVYGALPYTEITDDAQYLRLLFIVGYGPLEISDLRIGDTAIDEYEGVEYEVRPGRADDAPITLFSNTVLQQEFSVLVKQVDSWILRTSDRDADEISLDITFPGGLANIAGDGSRSNATVAVEVQYSPTGANTWTTVNQTAPDFSRGMDFMFRTPEVAFGGSGADPASLTWGEGFGTKPAYLPATNYSWEGSGYLECPTTGTYEFALDSSDAAEIRIDGRVVASWYGDHATLGAGTPDYSGHQGSVSLTAGFHRIEVRVVARTTPGAIAVAWKRPGDGAFAAIPAASLHRQSRNAIGQSGALNYRWYTTTNYTGTLTTTASRTDTIRRSINFAVPRGRYDVRIRRITPDSTSTSTIDVVYLTALRTIRNVDPIKIPGLARVAIRIRATDQLQGVIDQFNVLARSILPDWEPAQNTWVERGTSSPAAHYRAILQGPAMGRKLADARLDLNELQVWAEEARARGLEFNGIFDSPGTVFQRLADVCAAGRGSFGMKNGLYSIVRDYPRTTPRQFFTPANSFGFSSQKTFPKIPHALRVGFIDSAIGYQRNEKIVLNDGYQIDGLDAFGNERPDLPDPTEYDTLELTGSVTWAEAFRHGRYHLAVLKLRPETYSLGTDFEHLVCERGDMVYVTHDVPKFGLQFGRIVNANTDSAGNVHSIDLDEEITMDAHDDYGVIVRCDDATSYRGPVVTAEGVSHRLTFAQIIPAGSPNIPKVDNLVMFGRIGQETHELVVKGVNINGDLSAQLTLVDHAPAIHSAETETIPPYDPDISQPPLYEDRPETPVIERIQSDDFVMIRDADGSLRPRMLITLRRPGGVRPLANAAQVKTRPFPLGGGDPVGPWTTHPLAPIDSSQVSVENVEEGVTYQIRLRTVTATGLASRWAEAVHTVVGKTAPPPDVDSFTVSRLSDGTRRYAWTFPATPPDLAGVLIRYGEGNPTWDQMTPLHDGILQSSPDEMNEPPAGTWKFAIRGIDTSGNLSVNPFYLDAITLGEPRLEGVAFSKDERFDGWPGTKTDCHATSDGLLEADDLATWDTLDDYGAPTWDTWSRWIMAPKTPIAYESESLDAGFEFEFSPDAIVAGEGDITVSLSWSSDNVAWTSYQLLSHVRGTAVRARYLRVRVTCNLTSAFPVPIIRRCLVLMRAPQVVHEINDLDTSTLPNTRRERAGDIRLPLPLDRFNVVRFIDIAFNGMGPGWTWELIDRDPTIGPRIKIYNQAGELADAAIDARVRGL